MATVFYPFDSFRRQPKSHWLRLWCSWLKAGASWFSFFSPSFRWPMLNCFEWLPRWRGQRWWTTRHGAERRSEWGQHECLGNFCCQLKHFSAAKLTAVPLRSELPRWNGNGLSAVLVDLWRLTHSSASSHWGSDIYISYQCSTSFAKTKWL